MALPYPTIIPGLRSPTELVGGIVYFGRMLDKMRLAAAGKLPEGWQAMRGMASNVTFDARCCRFLGISYAALEPRRKYHVGYTDPDGSDLRIEIRWVDPPDRVGRPRVDDPEMVRYMIGTSLILGMFAAILTFMWEKEAPKPPLALNPERVAKIEAPAALEFEKKQVREAQKAESNSKEKEGQTKKAKDKAGKIGRDDAKQKDTVIPKGREDVLREKVLNTGIFSALGRTTRLSGIARCIRERGPAPTADASV